MTKFYRLQSFEGHVFVVDEAVALQSPLVERRAVEAGAGGIIVMEAADTKSLRKVLEWCEMHTPEKKATVPPEELRKWEEEYIDPCRFPLRLLAALTYMEMEDMKGWLLNRVVDKAIFLAERDTEEMGREIRAGKVFKHRNTWLRHSLGMW